jgi:hypothetical protein
VPRTLGILILLTLFAAPAAASGLVRGEGFRFRVPPEFEASPSAQSQTLRTELEALVSGAALPLSGAPRFRSRVNMADGVQLGTLVSLCYRLPAGTGITDVAQVEGERLELGFQAIDPDRNRPKPRVKQREVGRERMGLELRLNMPEAPGEIWCVMALENDHLLVLAYQRELPSEGDAAWWGATLGSIHLEKHGVAQGLTTTILGAGALIGLLLLWLTIRLVRHRRSVAAMGGAIIMEGGAAGIRASDGLSIDQGGAPDAAPDPDDDPAGHAEEIQEPEEAPYPYRFGLPPLEETSTPTSSATAEPPAPEAAEPVRPEREAVNVAPAPRAAPEPPASPKAPSERSGKPGPLRIQRNNDFLA